MIPTFLWVWNLGAFPITSPELPAVEWAFDTVAHNSPANGKIGAHMWAVGVNDMRLSIFRTEYGQIQPCQQKLGKCLILSRINI